ncbi:exo-alpha-sialidase [Candidatus Dojkabacteria bacterium]|uniref:Exo-alpha-sialidase n=1 Tax=Candidatus Dojkabacteria bacterium TaxID=2099670 RepID=A0A955RIN6_9BACT|nr:exo-alpha-sialidase [Candidatus Dojkabacteria bacterium]
MKRKFIVALFSINIFLLTFLTKVSAESWSTPDNLFNINTGVSLFYNNYPSIDVRSNGNIAINYSSSIAAGGIIPKRYYYYEITPAGSSVEAENIDALTSTGDFSDITIDNNGDIVSPYLDNNLGELKFAKSTDGGATWSKYTIDNTAYVGYWTSFAIDASNNYLVAYYDLDNDSLKFAKSTDGGVNWSEQTLDIAGYGTEFIIDTNGDYVIFYYGLDGGFSEIIKEARSTDGGTSWNTTELFSAENYYADNNISAEIDLDGNLVFSYFDAVDGLLHIAYEESGVWTTEVVDSTSTSGTANKLAVDIQGNLLIAYVKNSQLNVAELKYGETVWSISNLGVTATQLDFALDLAKEDNYIVYTYHVSGGTPYDSYNYIYRDRDLISPTFSFTTPPPSTINSGSELILDLSVLDSETPIVLLEYRIDEGPWISYPSNDGSLDELMEEFMIDISDLSIGTHTIQLRAYDQENNIGEYSFTIEVLAVLADTGDPFISFRFLLPLVIILCLKNLGRINQLKLNR